MPEAISTHVAAQYDAIWDWYESKSDALVRIFSTPPGYESNAPGNAAGSAYRNNVALFQSVRDVFIAALNQLAAARDADLIDGAGLTAALANYATIKTTLDSDPDLALVDTATTNEELTTPGGSYSERYKAKLSTVLTAAGLVPNFEGTSTGATVDPCWFDDPSATQWWRVESSDGQQWAHWHTGFPYYSVVERRENGAVVYERLDIVGLNIEINCPDALLVGDTMTITILGTGTSGNVADNRFYQVGDVYKLDTIFGEPIPLQGGVSGDDTHTWAVAGSVDGAKADYAVIHGSEALYTNGGAGDVNFRIYRGGRPAALGDKLTFNVEKAQYEWRKNGGGWSTAANLPAAATTLTDGLDIRFDAGVDAPNWADQDIYSFEVIARYQPAHIQAPGHGAYQFDGSTATITIDLGSDQPIDIVAFPGLLDLPAGASIALRGLSAADAELWTHNMTVRTGMWIDWFADIDDPVTIPARKLEITLTNATGARLGWIYAGAPIMPTFGCVRSSISPAYLMGGDASTAQLFFGAGHAGLFEWDQDLSWSDLQALYSLVDHVKRNQNQPIVAIADPDELDIVGLCRVDTDNLSVTHVDNYRKFERTLTPTRGKGASLSLPLSPVYQS